MLNIARSPHDIKTQRYPGSSQQGNEHIREEISSVHEE